MPNEQNLKPFKKGDPRINRKGRPKDLLTLRALAKQIASEVVEKSGGNPLVVRGHTVTKVEAILRQWSTSRDARLQMAFIEYAYGKPPAAVEHSGSVAVAGMSLEQFKLEEKRRLAQAAETIAAFGGFEESDDE